MLDELGDAYDQLGSSQQGKEHEEVTMLRRAPLPLASLIRMLNPDQVFVEYVMDHKNSYAIEVSNSGMTVHTLPAAEKITGLTGGFIAAINAMKNERPKAQALYSLLLSPISKRVEFHHHRAGRHPALAPLRSASE